MKEPVRSEHIEQVAVCEWFHLQYPQYRGYLFAIPNGGRWIATGQPWGAK